MFIDVHYGGVVYMKYSVTGFPRIGAKRELKFITESYFRGDVSLADLTKVVKEQREVQWKVCWTQHSR